MHGCVADVPNREALPSLTFITGVVDLDILECPWTGISEDGAVHRDVAVCSALAPRPDDPQRPRGHAVDGPVRVAVIIADGDGEPPIVGPDDVEMEAGLAGDVEPAVLAGVVSLVLVPG